MNTQQRSTNTATSLRPRNRRLIPIEDDLEAVETGPTSAPLYNSASSSAFTTSRAASPIPSTNPSRATSTNSTSQRASSSSRNWGLRVPSTPLTSSLFSPGYWESSWSSLQGVASTLLGNELTNGPRSAALPKTKRMDGGHAHKYGGLVKDEWGPSANVERHIAYGSQEDRLARVQAKKREALLTANGHSTPDALGRYKRRVSIDRDTTIPSPDESPDTLVYLHTVQPGDTLAGLSIKYNCPQAVLRKANRLWPNDSIQIRKIAYLPVDSCGIRGKKIPSPESANIDTLGDSSSSHQFDDSAPTPTMTESNSDWFVPATPKASTQSYSTTAFSSTATSPSQTTKSTTDTEPPWIPDSWVQVDTFPTPIQIARLPRRTLGFFPPTRRKSTTIAYSDTTPPHSAATSPHPFNPSPRRTRPFSPSSPSHTSKPNRHRSSSSIASLAAANSYLTTHLHGPGGVGTLDSTSLHPGPAQDKLNQIFAPHLPNVAPRSSFESVGSVASSTGLGVGELGGKVEGWVRKMAQKTAMVAAGGGSGTGSLGEGGGRGDLIELVEGWDMGGGGTSSLGEEGEEWGMNQGRGGDAERGRTRRVPGARNDIENGDRSADTSTNDRDGKRETSALGTTARDDEERLLKERFPARGRVFDEQPQRRNR